MRVPSMSVPTFVHLTPVALVTWVLRWVLGWILSWGLIWGLTCAAMGLVAPVSSIAFSTPAAAQVESVAVEFRTALQPYGAFHRIARWGEVWVPNVAADWRPYTVGRWVYSDDYGWYWVSDAPEAPWGWVVFHYGRWIWIDDLGWAWVPGTQWGPAWVGWRRGEDYIGWAPLPPQDLVVEIRDQPQYWVFCQPADFLVTNISTVFIEPQPIFLRETVVVNETVLIRDHDFAVNPGIQPAYIAAFIGRPVPEYSVRPHVLAGTVSLPNAIEVTGEDLRSGDFRRDLMRQTNIRQTNTIEPARNLSPPQPLGRGEHGRLGDNPPRAAQGFAQERQPGAVGQGSEQREGYQRGSQEGARGLPEQQRGFNARGATNPQQQRGFTERGANRAGEQRRLFNRGETGFPPGNEGGLRRGENGALQQPRNLQQQRGPAVQQRGFTERGGAAPNAPSSNAVGRGQQREMFNRGETGLPGEQGATRQRGSLGGSLGAPPEQRSLRGQGAGRSLEQRGFGAGPAGPSGFGSRERGAMSPPSGQGQLFNRAPAAPMSPPQRSLGERAPGGSGSGPGPGASRPQHFERGH